VRYAPLVPEYLDRLLQAQKLQLSVQASQGAASQGLQGYGRLQRRRNDARRRGRADGHERGQQERGDRTFSVPEHKTSKSAIDECHHGDSAFADDRCIRMQL
jgi:hypothetical protein